MAAPAHKGSRSSIQIVSKLGRDGGGRGVRCEVRSSSDAAAGRFDGTCHSRADGCGTDRGVSVGGGGVGGGGAKTASANVPLDEQPCGDKA